MVVEIGLTGLGDELRVTIIDTGRIGGQAKIAILLIKEVRIGVDVADALGFTLHVAARAPDLAADRANVSPQY